MKFIRGSVFKPEKDYYKYAGSVLLVGAIQFFLAITFAETQFPGYSVARNSLSTLGGSVPLVEPSAMVFNYRENQSSDQFQQRYAELVEINHRIRYYPVG